MDLDRGRASLRGAILAAMLTVGGASAAPAGAEALDPNQAYEQKCARCHGDDAGDFARKRLRRNDDRIVGAENGLELQAFLARGHGRLTPSEVAPMFAMLRSFVETKPAD